MDRTAWVAVALCVVGLVLWEVYSITQSPPRPATTASSSVPATTPSVSASPNAAPSAVSPSPGSPIATPGPQPASTAAAFPEATELLRNSDLELQVTNRGGGVVKAVLLNHTAEEDKRVTLNSEDHIPIG